MIFIWVEPCCLMLANLCVFYSCLCNQGNAGQMEVLLIIINGAGGQPNRYNNQLNCVSFDMRSDTWSYTNCAAYNSWICKITKGTLNKFYIFLIL